MTRALLVGCLLWAGAAAQAEPLDSHLQGAWVSPDWFLPGTRSYGEAEVRSRSRRVVSELAEAGFNTVFLETFLRGYSIAPAVKNGKATAELPVYPHLRWNYRSDGSRVYDALQIFVDEAAEQGIEVHAWTHMFYWKMDNPGANLAWHAAPSLWSQWMTSYLRSQADGLEGRPATAPDTVALLRESAALFQRSTDAGELQSLLGRHHLPAEGRPLGVLLRTALRAGAERPDFLLMGSDEDPFPAPRGRELRPIYLNPGCARVQARLVEAVDSLVQGHPGLAGVHLDHIRYPVDGQGLPDELDVQDGTYNYYSQASPEEMGRYNQIGEQLSARRENLRLLVERMAERVGHHRKLSAAVLPVYYRERDNGRYRLGGYDFSSQDWVSWKVDFVVPMLYELSPSFIRNLLSLFADEQLRRRTPGRIIVYPGMSQPKVARTALADAPGWVFFNLTLSRDVKLDKKEPTEDLNFGPQ